MTDETADPVLHDMSGVALETLFQPTEYTCLIHQFMQQNPDRVEGQSVCEIGTGNGAIAAQAALLGAKAITVSDIEPTALQAARACHAQLPCGGQIFEYLNGPLWAPFAKRKFDLILANLPHFPAKHLDVPGRLPSWSNGGPDGRALLDPFIDGLAAHLSPGGGAVFTHNRFADLDQTKARVEALGLQLTAVCDTVVYIPPIKSRALTKGVTGYGRDIYSIGPYTFGRLCLALVEWPAA